MPAKKLVVYNPINWLAVLLHLLILGLLVGVGIYLGGIYGMIGTTLCYIAFSQISRNIILKDLYQGMSLLRSGAYPGAIKLFRQCADFLGDHLWLDRYRAITMLSPGELTFRETCLCNIAYAHLQMKEIDEAIRAYQDVLVEYPNCLLATTSLENIELVKDAGKRKEP